VQNNVALYSIWSNSCTINNQQLFFLFDLQLDTQNSYLFTYTFIKILYMFRALPCLSSGGLRRNCIYAASGIVSLCRWLSCAPVKKEPVSKTVTCREWRYQRLHIYTFTTWTSWRWAELCSKHVEEFNKCVMCK